MFLKTFPFAIGCYAKKCGFNQISDKNKKSMFKECDYHRIQQYSDQNY